MVNGDQPPNAAQATCWAGPSGVSWITHEDDMDRLLDTVKEVVLAKAGSVDGLDVLDIGCGTGALSLALAEAGAAVTACDISQPLLDRTRERAGAGVKTLLADAQTALWEGSYDLAVSRFGVMFFENPARAFANIAAALKPGGRTVFAAWGPFKENLWWHMPQTIASEVLGLPPKPPDPHAPGPMGLSDKDWSLARMGSPAWETVACETLDVTLELPKGAVAAGRLATFVGPAARVLNMHDAPEEAREQTARRIGQALLAHESNGTARIPARLHLFTAIKA